MQYSVILLEREEPLDRLELAYRDAVGGRGRVVSIEGEAGIGKTSTVLSFAAAHRADAVVYMGGCEHLATPEPLGPLRDVARDSRSRFVISDTSPLATFESLLRLLTQPPGVTVLVIEDLHWADDLTLDLLRFLARRIRAARTLIVVTARSDDFDPSGRLAKFWPDLSRDNYERVELGALSFSAVSALAVAAGRPPREVFDSAGGNPFHVTEYLATARGRIPRGIQDATLARRARLTLQGQRALDCASIFPRRIDEATLRTLIEDMHHAGVEECLSMGMLNVHNEALSFRHELARRAVYEAMSPLHRRELHLAALTALKARADLRAAEAAHHAEMADAAEDVIMFSAKAAEDAETLGAHSDAVAHLAKAIAYGGGLPESARAALLERQAEAGERCGALAIATSAIDAAIALRRTGDDPSAFGNALRISSRLRWHTGEIELAHEHADGALELLRDGGETWQYALALSGRSQLAMLAYRTDDAIAGGAAAMAIAARLGRSDIYMHALTNVATAQAQAHTDDGLIRIKAAIVEARRRGQLDALPRLYTNLCDVMACARRYDGLFELFEEGLAAAAARDNLPLQAYMRGSRAHALLDMGRLHEAVLEAEAVVDGPYPAGISSFPALIVLSRARVRLGVADGGAIDRARALATARRDLMRQSRIAVADAEANWLGEMRPGASHALREGFEQALSTGCELWALAEPLLWLSILGEPVEFPAGPIQRVSPAHRLHIAGRWTEAAAAWRDRGCPYEEGLALSMGDEAARRMGLALFDKMDARPASRRLRRDLRKSGVRGLPVGARSPRRNNPAGLTPRQDHVLALLALGLSNGEIAARIGTSPKTVEHHVGAILAALDAVNRLQAVHIARERGLLMSQEDKD